MYSCDTLSSNDTMPRWHHSAWSTDSGEEGRPTIIAGALFHAQDGRRLQIQPANEGTIATVHSTYYRAGQRKKTNCDSRPCLHRAHENSTCRRSQVQQTAPKRKQSHLTLSSQRRTLWRLRRPTSETWPWRSESTLYRNCCFVALALYVYSP